MPDESLLASLLAAVAGNPDDVPLRLHVAEMLIAAGRADEAIPHVAAALALRPSDEKARALMGRAIARPGDGAPSSAELADDSAQRSGDGVDWAAYENELGDVVPPRFVRADGSPPVEGDADRMVDVERPSVTLADVGGMAEVKQRLDLAFLGPLRNPELQGLYGKRLRGGLLLYGPPGCGKTFLARAVAGELGAKFVSVSLTDVLDMWVGNSERNLHEVFLAARRSSPCVLFLDEVDALALKRTQAASTGLRTTINQLLAELDGMEGDNDGVFVLAATNAPWDVDPALRRPGRLDRMMLVLPPDAPAREAILRYHLQDRPVARVNLARLVAATEHFSGADLAHVCDTAAEYAMHDSITSGTVRMMEQRDFDRALGEVRPSTGAWLDTARNVAMFANTAGDYDPLVAYLRSRKLL